MSDEENREISLEEYGKYLERLKILRRSLDRLHLEAYQYRIQFFINQIKKNIMTGAILPRGCEFQVRMEEFMDKCDGIVTEKEKEPNGMKLVISLFVPDVDMTKEEITNQVGDRIGKDKVLEIIGNLQLKGIIVEYQCGKYRLARDDYKIYSPEEVRRIIKGSE